MILLDTDVLTLVQREDSVEGLRVRARILQLPEDEMHATTIVNYEEQMRGWLNKMGQSRTPEEKLAAYASLLKHVANYRKLRVVPFDRPAVDKFEELRGLRLRIGTPDMRIAAIALALDATLVTRNSDDFDKVPGLRIEDWTKA